MREVATILSIAEVTHDVLKINTTKPKSLAFEPGQATALSLTKEGWQDVYRPFTFTSLPSEDYVEFVIKVYPDHKGLTNELTTLVVGDEIVLNDVFGAIRYVGEGLFIAGGSGITPFISILKSLEANDRIGQNKLIYANKSKADIIFEDRWRSLFGEHYINVLSDEDLPGYEHGYISAYIFEKYLQDGEVPVYLCGPEPMMAHVQKELSLLGVGNARIIKEAF